MIAGYLALGIFFLFRAIVLSYFLFILPQAELSYPCSLPFPHHLLFICTSLFVLVAIISPLSSSLFSIHALHFSRPFLDTLSIAYSLKDYGLYLTLVGLGHCYNVLLSTVALAYLYTLVSLFGWHPTQALGYKYRRYTATFTYLFLTRAKSLCFLFFCSTTVSPSEVVHNKCPTSCSTFWVLVVRHAGASHAKLKLEMMLLGSHLFH